MPNVAMVHIQNTIAVKKNRRQELTPGIWRDQNPRLVWPHGCSVAVRTRGYGRHKGSPMIVSFHRSSGEAM